MKHSFLRVPHANGIVQLVSKKLLIQGRRFLPYRDRWGAGRLAKMALSLIMERLNEFKKIP